MKITSIAFSNGEKIPLKYTCDGADISPPLDFQDIPQNARSLVLIVDDPDAPGGTWLHWTAWNIPIDLIHLEEGDPLYKAKEGVTNFGSIGYGGPCPPSGSHRYFFRLFALDSLLELGQGASREELEVEIEGKILAEAVLIGTYR